MFLLDLVCGPLKILAILSFQNSAYCPERTGLCFIYKAYLLYTKAVFFKILWLIQYNLSLFCSKFKPKLAKKAGLGKYFYFTAIFDGRVPYLPFKLT